MAAKKTKPHQHDPSIGFSVEEFGLKACMPELASIDESNVEQVAYSALVGAGCFESTIEITRQWGDLGHDGVGPHWELIAVGKAPMTCCPSKIADVYDLTGLYGYEIGLN